jgi:hypothetical protein
MYDDYINYYGFPRELGFIRTKQLTEMGEAGALLELIIPVHTLALPPDLTLTHLFPTRTHHPRTHPCPTPHPTLALTRAHLLVQSTRTLTLSPVRHPDSI